MAADLPVACTLSPAALKARKANLLNALLHRADERRELPDGYRLRFVADGDVLSVIARTVDAEQYQFNLITNLEGYPKFWQMLVPASICCNENMRQFGREYVFFEKRRAGDGCAFGAIGAVASLRGVG